MPYEEILFGCLNYLSHTLVKILVLLIQKVGMKPKLLILYLLVQFQSRQVIKICRTDLEVMTMLLMFGTTFI